MFCLYGDEVVRQIGLNLQGLKNKAEKVKKLASETDLSDVEAKWVPYGTEFEVYYANVLDHIRRWNR